MNTATVANTGNAPSAANPTMLMHRKQRQRRRQPEPPDDSSGEKDLRQHGQHLRRQLQSAPAPRCAPSGPRTHAQRCSLCAKYRNVEPIVNSIMKPQIASRYGDFKTCVKPAHTLPPITSPARRCPSRRRFRPLSGDAPPSRMRESASPSTRQLQQHRRHEQQRSPRRSSAPAPPLPPSPMIEPSVPPTPMNPNNRLACSLLNTVGHQTPEDRRVEQREHRRPHEERAPHPNVDRRAFLRRHEAQHDVEHQHAGDKKLIRDRNDTPHREPHDERREHRIAALASPRASPANSHGSLVDARRRGDCVANRTQHEIAAQQKEEERERRQASPALRPSRTSTTRRSSACSGRSTACSRPSLTSAASRPRLLRLPRGEHLRLTLRRDPRELSLRQVA